MKSILQTIVALFIIAGISLAQTYVGPEKCLQCHGGILKDASGWRTSMHANGYSDVTDDSRTMVSHQGIVCDYDQNGVDDFHDGLNFNNIDSKFDLFKPNAPILAYSTENGYTVTIGEVSMRVYLTYGGSGLYKQRYAVRIPASDGTPSADWYISPIQYNEKTHEYVLYHADDYWVYNDGTPSNVPVFTNSSTLADISTNSRSFTKGCSGCHVTGMVVNPQDANGEWTLSGGAIDQTTIGMYNDKNIFDLNGDGLMEQMNTGCERCHGPGGTHVTTMSRDDIINPATDMTPEEATNMCGFCHSRGKSLPNNTFSFAYDDANMHDWELGDMVADYYTDGGGYYDDKDSDVRSSKSHHQQFRDFYESSKPTYVYHEVTCYECHDVHNSVKHHIIEEMEETDSLGAPIMIATDNDDNTLCLACHATHGAFEEISVEMVADYENNVDAIGSIVSAHTNHDYDPTGSGESRCSKCHNPKSIKSAIHYDIHSHTFEVIPPEKTKEFAMPNACSVSCHRGIENGPDPIFNTGVDATLSDWTEASDIALADKLMEYYGPSGSWWDHAVSVEKIVGVMPENFKLTQNYPNPFNPTTTFEFSIPEAADVSVVVYDALGQMVTVLMNDFAPAGSYQITFDASNLTSGIYFYTMQAGNFVQTKKMILMK